MSDALPATPLMTPHDVAAYLRVTVQRLAIWRMEGRGPKYLKVETSVRYRRAEVDAWLNETAALREELARVKAATAEPCTDLVYDPLNEERNFPAGMVDELLIGEPITHIVQVGRLHELPPAFYAYVPTALCDDGTVEDGEWRGFGSAAEAERARQDAYAALANPTEEVPDGE